MKTLNTSLIILLATIYVLILDYIAGSTRSLQKVLILPLLVLLVLGYWYSKHPKALRDSNGAVIYFLLWGTLFVNMLVLSTGGFQSPFLVLIHLFMIALSFLVNFTASIIFLLLAFASILIDMSFHQDLLVLLNNDPNAITLQILSLIAITPLAYIISQQYHLKNVLLSMMHVKVTTDEIIIERLDELIVVTDNKLRILSVNDAVEKTLHKPRTELFGKKLFSILQLRDSKGRAVKKETFLNKDDSINPDGKINETFTLVNAPTVQNTLTVRIQPISDIDREIKQISFIFSFEKV